jgi:hypothetical protein
MKDYYMCAYNFQGFFTILRSAKDINTNAINHARLSNQLQSHYYHSDLSTDILSADPAKRPFAAQIHDTMRITIIELATQVALSCVSHRYRSRRVSGQS